MKIYPPFPTCREATPTRRAEKLIYEALEASELDGLALYEVKPLSSAPQLDFAVWLLDVGTFGIQTKGGRYIIIDGEWYLVTDRGRIRKESPIPGTWDAAMAIHDWVQEQLRHKTFVIPVLVLTDMEPDAEIEALAAARNVAVHWGSPDNLVEHLWSWPRSGRSTSGRRLPASPRRRSWCSPVQPGQSGLLVRRRGRRTRSTSTSSTSTSTSPGPRV